MKEIDRVKVVEHWIQVAMVCDWPFSGHFLLLSFLLGYGCCGWSSNM
jgi:hypothetical protein